MTSKFTTADSKKYKADQQESDMDNKVAPAPQEAESSKSKTSIDVFQSQVVESPDSDFVLKIKNALDRLLKPWEGNKTCQRMFRSTEAIQREKTRQLEENRFIIHPFCIFRWYWDLIMVTTLVITLITLPLEIAFFSNDSLLVWTVIHTTADVIFIIDIFFNFRTGFIHTDSGEVVLDSKATVINYLRTWFFIDLVASVPFDNLYAAFGQVDVNGDASDSVLLTLKVLRFTKLLRLLRIFRVARLVRYVHKLEELLEIEAKVLSIMNLVMVIIVFCHWNACIQYLASFIVNYPDFDVHCWIYIDKIHNDTATFGYKYSRSLWRAMSHMLSIGYGTTPPDGGLTETWLVTLSMMLGATFYALFVAHMSGLILTLDASGRKYEEKLSEVRQYMRFRRVPMDIQQRVVDYYDHKYQRKFFDEYTILHDHHMSLPLRQNIVMHNCKNLVEKVPFLTKAPEDFLFDIICKFQFQVYFPGDIIVTAGRKGDSMYFIEHGKVDVILPGGQVVNTLSDGTYFGEISLLLEERRVASVVAKEICDMYVLRKIDFNHVLDEYPRMGQVMEHIARERLASLGKISKDVPKVIALENERAFSTWTDSLKSLHDSWIEQSATDEDPTIPRMTSLPTAVPSLIFAPISAEDSITGATEKQTEQ